MRNLFAALALSLLGIGLTGCTSAPTPPSEPSSTPRAVSDTIGLVGTWRVSDAEGETADTWLRLDAGEAQLWRECGVDHYSWGGRDGAFIASAWLWAYCGETEPPVASWLEGATAYEKDGDGWILLDGEGAVVARLAEDGAPPSTPDNPDGFTQPPSSDTSIASHFQQPAPLPDSLSPGDITGRWLTEELSDNPRVFVEFGPGAWTASDGCNHQRGRWVSVGPGLLVAGSSFSTEIGCENIPIASWVMETTSAGFDGETLVLVDTTGAELVRLVPDVSASSDISADGILGRWLAVGAEDRPEVFVEFGPAEWTASDGCNGQQGTWAVAQSGFIAQGSGISTQIGCDNVPVALWVLDATSAHFDGDTLVLVGAQGRELGRLVRG
ncbi:MAG: hypothetical protein ACOH19_11640 [Rhodoglobus sp.]